MPSVAAVFVKPSRGTLLLAAVIAVQLLPIWLLTRFPSQDGPVHLALVHVMREYANPDAQVLRDYFTLSHFTLNREAVPNWFVYWVLADVLRFVSVPVAEKILLSAYVILLPLSCRYALGGVAPENRFLAVLALPFTFNFLLGMGFYNFSLSLVAFFVALGWWLRYLKEGDPLKFLPTAGFAALLVWVYFCHAVTLVALIVALGAASAWLAARDIWGGGSVARALRQRLLGLTLAALPALFLTVSYASGLGSRRAWLPLGDNLLGLATLTSLVSIDNRIHVLSSVLAFSLIGLAGWLLVRRFRTGGLGAADPLLAAAAALLILNLAAPQQLGIGGLITYRLSLFPYLVLILWLATFEHPPRRRLALQILGAGVALGMLAFLVPRWRDLDRRLDEGLMAARWIEPGSTLLSVPVSGTGENPDGSRLADRVLPFLHAGDFVAASKTVVSLDLFAAGTEAFPVRYRPERNPYRYLLDVERRLDFQYPRETGGRVDYVMVWWPDARRPRYDFWKGTLGRLERDFDRVYTSPSGMVRLYRRKG